VPDTQNDDLIANNALADNVRIRNHHFAHIGLRNDAASMREIHETITGINNFRRDLSRGTRVELFYAIPDGLKVFDRRLSPYDYGQMC